MGAVLRAVCKIAVLRVLTAYIPRTPGPKKATTRAWPKPGLLPCGAPANRPRDPVRDPFFGMCIYMSGISMKYVWNMEYSWNTHGICMEHVWTVCNMCGDSCNMYRICSEYAWNMYGVSMEYLRNMCGICMENVRNVHGISMEHVWNMSGIYMSELIYSHKGEQTNRTFTTTSIT
jgi:hypothetical protein